MLFSTELKKIITKQKALIATGKNCNLDEVKKNSKTGHDKIHKTKKK